LRFCKKNELSQINAIRKAHQVGELVLDETLCNYAMKHAEEMKNWNIPGI